MIIGLDTGLWACLVWVVILFLSYFFCLYFHWMLAECSPFTDLFCRYVQEGMLANVESLKKWQAGRYCLSNPPGDIVRRKVKLSLVFVYCKGELCKLHVG